MAHGFDQSSAMTKLAINRYRINWVAALETIGAAATRSTKGSRGEIRITIVRPVATLAYERIRRRELGRCNLLDAKKTPRIPRPEPTRNVTSSEIVRNSRMH